MLNTNLAHIKKCAHVKDKSIRVLFHRVAVRISQTSFYYHLSF